MHIETLAVHSGVLIDSQYKSVTTPIYQTSTFFAGSLDEKLEFDYTRSGNPTRHGLETNLAALENGVAASVTATGMAAILAALSLLDAGDHLITTHDIYGGTFRLFANAHKKFGIEVTFIKDLNDHDELAAKIKPNTKLIWIETPSNPLLHLIDIGALVDFIKEKHPSILLAADNTFMSPYFQRPLDLGCDLVVHSTTKYINGHSDVVGGVVISKEPNLAKKVAYMVNCLGLASSPFDAWLVLRGVKTLPLRMEAHQRNALEIAQFLEKHELVKKVFYPGLKSHPQFDLAQKQMLGFGGMLSFSLNLQKADINKFFANLKLFPLAVSLGGVESLIAQPCSMSHASMTEEARKNAGIDNSIVRISAGVENSEDLLEDLNSALTCCCC